MDTGQVELLPPGPPRVVAVNYSLSLPTIRHFVSYVIVDSREQRVLHILSYIDRTTTIIRFDADFVSLQMIIKAWALAASVYALPPRQRFPIELLYHRHYLYIYRSCSTVVSRQYRHNVIKVVGVVQSRKR